MSSPTPSLGPGSRKDPGTKDLVLKVPWGCCFCWRGPDLLFEGTLGVEEEMTRSAFCGYPWVVFLLERRKSEAISVHNSAMRVVVSWGIPTSNGHLQPHVARAACNMYSEKALETHEATMCRDSSGEAAFGLHGLNQKSPGSRNPGMQKAQGMLRSTC